MNSGGEAAYADSGNDAGARAGVDESEAGDILAHRAETIGGARPAPVGAAVIREIKARLCAGHDVVAVARIDSHFADSLVLRELARWQRQAWPEHIRALQNPGGARVG